MSDLFESEQKFPVFFSSKRKAPNVWYIYLFRSKIEDNVGGRIILVLTSFISKKPKQYRTTFYHQKSDKKRWQKLRDSLDKKTNKEVVNFTYGERVTDISIWLTDAERLWEGK